MRVRTHVNPLSYIERMPKIDYFATLKRLEFLDFEIGFGRGIFLKNYAINNPARNIIGIEIRKPLVEELQALVQKDALENLYLVHGKAETCLEDTIDDKTLDRIFLFHPDPWLKRNHHKRRVIQPKFLELLQQKLKDNGKIFISTDVEELWEDMQNCILKNPTTNFKKSLAEDFWQNEYMTDWDIFSRRTNRKIFYGTFGLV